MTEEKKRWIILIAVSFVLACGLGTLIYFQHDNVEKGRKEASSLRNTIEDHRALIALTPELVKKVIVQRETDVVIKEILSDEEDINNLVRTLQKFEVDSGITITSLKKQRDASRAKRGRQDFDRVGYTISFDGDGFQLLDFLDKVETHARFMSVTAFKLTAASRQDYDEDGGPRHRVQLDLETYVYNSAGAAKQVRIDHYERKRDLLISEISKRAAELRIESYDFQGQRGRRDPWVDPRIPVDGGGDALPIPDQIEMVLALIEKTKEADAALEQLGEAPNVIAEMKARANVEEQIAFLEQEILRIRSENLLTFVPVQSQFEQDVVLVVDDLRVRLTERQEGYGPSLAELRQTAEAMQRHIRNQEYELAQEVFKNIETQLAIAEQDELKRTLVQSLRELHVLAETVLEFESIQLEISGIALYEDHRPVALINGQPVTEGEIIGNELIVRNIGSDQIEFAFRGLVLARVIETGQRQ